MQGVVMTTINDLLRAPLRAEAACVQPAAEIVHVYKSLMAQEATRTGLPPRYWALLVDADARATLLHATTPKRLRAIAASSRDAVTLSFE